VIFHRQTRHRAAVAAAVSAVLLILAASRTGQGLYSDPALQLKTVQQYLAGESPRLNVWMRPDADDIGRDQLEGLVVWAPGTPLAAFPFMRAGLSVAHATRAVAGLAVLAGSIGWVYWFSLFQLPERWVIALALALPWMRSVSNALFLYGSDILAFAFVPWVLLLTLAALRRTSTVGCAIAGLLGGLLYVAKDSAAFVTAGIIVWLAWLVWRAESHDRAWRIAALTAFALAAGVPVLILTAVNHEAGAANLLTATLDVGFRWRTIAHALAQPALAAADLDGLLRYVLMHPTHGVTQNVLWVSLLGLPGGLALVVLTARGRAVGAHAELARAVFATSVVAILAVWSVSVAVSIEARHLASAGLCILPLALAEGRSWWPSSGRIRRAAIAALVVGYVALPLAYGVVSVPAKVWRFPRDYRSARSGVYNQLLAEHDAAGVVAQLQRDFSPETDVWYLTEPMTALDLKGRAIVVHADFTDVDQLRRYRFVTSRPLRVHVLLPPRFEENGKGQAIRASFPQAAEWHRDEVAGSEYDRWRADLSIARP
jgi:hypothetical protein